MSAPHLLWDWGTAYDLFISLAVLHHPADFGVRGAWAADFDARLRDSARAHAIRRYRSRFPVK